MHKIIHFLGLDVHKESIAVSIAPSDSIEVRFYGNIGGRLDDVERLAKKLQEAHPGVELRFCYEAGPTGYPLCRHLRKKQFVCLRPRHRLPMTPGPPKSRVSFDPFPPFEINAPSLSELKLSSAQSTHDRINHEQFIADPLH